MGSVSANARASPECASRVSDLKSRRCGPSTPRLHPYLTQRPPPAAGSSGDSGGAAVLPACPGICLIYNKARPAVTQVSSSDVLGFCGEIYLHSCIHSAPPMCSHCTEWYGDRLPVLPLPLRGTTIQQAGTCVTTAGDLLGVQATSLRPIPATPPAPGPPTPSKLTSAGALEHLRLDVKPNKPQVKPLTSEPRPQLAPPRLSHIQR